MLSKEFCLVEFVSWKLSVVGEVVWRRTASEGLNTCQYL